MLSVRIRAVQDKEKIRFLTYHVHITKCLLDTKYKQNPVQTVLNKVLALKRTSYGT